MKNLGFVYTYLDIFTNICLGLLFTRKQSFSHLKQINLKHPLCGRLFKML